jgi:hypothetical protein
MNFADRKALKQKYLECFGIRATNMVTWQEAVRDLTDQGVSRETLADWAVAAGYSRGYVSSLLSRIFCSLGLRKRGAGGGRKPSPDALELLAHARSRYGYRFLKVLRAAWRAGRTQTAEDGPPESLHRDRMSANVAPQLGRSFKTATLHSNTRGIRPGREQRQSSRTVFKGNSSATTARTTRRKQL